MDIADSAKSLRTARQLNKAFMDAEDQDHDSADEPEIAPEGHASFVMYQTVGGGRRDEPVKGQWVTKVTVTSEWVSFDDV